MGHQIIEQPDGRLCIWSTYVDEIIVWDASDEDLVEYYAKRAAEDARRHTRETITAVHAGEPPYYQFTKSFAQAYGQHLGRGAKPLELDTALPEDVAAAVETERARWVAEIAAADAAGPWS